MYFGGSPLSQQNGLSGLLFILQPHLKSECVEERPHHYHALEKLPACKDRRGASGLEGNVPRHSTIKCDLLRIAKGGGGCRK